MSPAALPQDPPAEAGRLLSASAIPLCAVCRSDCAPSRGKPKLPPLTVLVSAASPAQRDGSGGSRLSTMAYKRMPSKMGISNCR